jgi:hypothetical protein
MRCVQLSKHQPLCVLTGWLTAQQNVQQQKLSKQNVAAKASLCDTSVFGQHHAALDAAAAAHHAASLQKLHGKHAHIPVHSIGCKSTQFWQPPPPTT